MGIDYLKTLSSLCEKAIRDTKLSDDDLRDIFALHKRVCLALAPYDFDSYLLYVEWNRQPDKKFYPPRRRVLKQVVDYLQELAAENLKKPSANGAYADMANKAADGMIKNYSGNMLSGPELIAKTVRKAVTKRRPHTRYLIGFGSKPMVWTHKIFGDRVFDWVIKNFS